MRPRTQPPTGRRPYIWSRLAGIAVAGFFVFLFVRSIGAQETNDAAFKVVSNAAYKSGPGLSDYERERCKLDLFVPPGPKGFPTLVWFHGGGLKGGNKEGNRALALSLCRVGVGFVSVNYRLSPQAKFPAYVQDAAAAIAWTRTHISEYGGDPAKLFVGGHSAGGYLTLMLGVDDRYLRECGLERSAITGLIPISGQTMTHYTVREERGIGQFTITVDEAAPVHFGRKDTPPMLVLYADHDMVARREENEYFVAIMKGAGNERVSGQLISDRNHGTIASRMTEEGDPARAALLDFIRRHSESRQAP